MTTSHTLRHALAGAAGVAIALVGAMAMSAPATATGPLQTGSDSYQPSISLSVDDSTCLGAEGQRKIDWKITNRGRSDATVTEVTTAPQGEIDLDGVVLYKNKATIVSEKVPASAHKATLTFKAAWDKDTTSNRNRHDTVEVTKTVQLNGACTPSTQCISAAGAHFTHTFNGPAGTASISLTGDKALCAGQSQKFLLVSYFAPSPRAEWPQYKFDTDVQQIDSEHSSIDLAVDVPACFTQVDLVFGDELINPMVANGPRYNDRKLGSGGAPGNRSSGKPAWYNGGTSTCAMPAATMTSSCDGKVTVHLSNDKDAHYAVPFTVTAGLNGPKFTQQVSVEPGKSVEVEVPAESADKITVTTDGDFVAEGMWMPGHCQPPTIRQESTCDQLKIFVSNPQGNLPAEVVITYGAKVEHRTINAGQTEEVDFSGTDVTEATVDFPDFEKSVTVVYDRGQDCSSPSPEPSPSNPGSSTPPSGAPTPSHSTPGLPVTGVQVGVFAALGALLLAAGAVLFVGARRRRLTEAQ